jgi:hypothetical protein
MEPSGPNIRSHSSFKLLFLIVVVCAFTLFLSTSARADGVNFADPSTDSVSGTFISSTTDAVASFGLCGFGTFTIPGTSSTVTAEGCTATMTAPANFFFSGEAIVLVSENGKISDALIIHNFDDVTAQLLFLSDSVVNGTEVGLPSSTLTVLCSQSNSCTTTTAEQFSTHVNWRNGTSRTSDVVSFQSDTDGVVPEPGSLALLGSGLLAIGGLIKKRLA